MLLCVLVHRFRFNFIFPCRAKASKTGSVSLLFACLRETNQLIFCPCSFYFASNFLPLLSRRVIFFNLYLLLPLSSFCSISYLIYRFLFEDIQNGHEVWTCHEARPKACTWHAAMPCSNDMQHGHVAGTVYMQHATQMCLRTCCTDMQQGQAAEKYSMDMTCSIGMGMQHDIQHTHAAWTSSKDTHHRHRVQHRHEVCSCCTELQHGEAV